MLGRIGGRVSTFSRFMAGMRVPLRSAVRAILEMLMDSKLKGKPWPAASGTLVSSLANLYIALADATDARQTSESVSAPRHLANTSRNICKYIKDIYVCVCVYIYVYILIQE